MNDVRITLDDEWMLIERGDGKTLRITLNGWMTNLEGGYRWESKAPEGMDLKRQTALFEAFLSGGSLTDLKVA